MTRAIACMSLWMQGQSIVLTRLRLDWKSVLLFCRKEWSRGPHHKRDGLGDAMVSYKSECQSLQIL